MNRDRLVQLLAAAGVLVGLGSSMALTSALAGSAGRHQLVYTTRAEEGMTREEALGVAMGAFRGLFVNLLWMRAEDLKEEGKYYEAVDLAKTITKLQPRLPQVWIFHAWNLAYNISVATQNPEERWQWVNAGIRLLRDQGIPANPNEMKLYRELGWMLLQKVEGTTDEANRYYKIRFAMEWTIAAGAPPMRTAENRNKDVAVKDFVAHLQPIADAPDTLEQVIAATPAVADLVHRLRTEAHIDPVAPDDRLNLLRAVEFSRSATRRHMAPPSLKDLPANISQQDRNAATAIALLNDPAFAAAAPALVHHVRKRVLVDTYHMEPDRMIRYTQKYGPIDWRLPETHALYWTECGVEKGLQYVDANNAKNMDFINTDRNVLQSVQELFRFGSLLFDIATPDKYFVTPNPDFISTYMNIMDELEQREEHEFKVKYNVDITLRIFRVYAMGYENFMDDAIVLLYRRGQRREAEDLKMKLVTWAGLNKNDPTKDMVLRMPIDDFVKRQIKDDLTRPNLANQEIVDSLQSAFVNGLVAGDDETFRNEVAYAKEVHAEFAKEMMQRGSIVDPDKPRLAFVLPDFNEIAGVVLAQTVFMVPPADGPLLYRRAPTELQVVAYDFILDQELGAGKPDPKLLARFNQVFPEPPGLAAYRAKRDAADKANGQRLRPDLK